MPHTRQAPQAGPGESRIIGDRDLADPDGENQIDAIDAGGRRWYHLRPKPRRRTDFGPTRHGGWRWDGLLLILFALSPWPWW
jgi:hypothetical protein